MHPRVAAFLEGERRQVWALRRDDGTPVFMPEGMAAEMRAHTRQHLRCTYPDCTATISTRGGTRRDHFFHVNAPNHPTGPESEFHLAAKAMLAQWARPRIPDGAVVREEESIKDDDGRLTRRPDVLVTGATGRRVAFEVEYKSWSVEGWDAKQGDLDRASVACLWLMGHTRIGVVRDAYVQSGTTVVRLPELACAIGRADYPLLLVNPVTRQVGTLSASPSFARRWRGEREAYLDVDDLDDCTFDPRLGIRTPTLDRVLVAEALAQRRDAERQQWEVAVRTRLELAWQNSAVYADLMARHGEIPAFLAEGAGGGGAIRALGVHWRSALYADLVEDRTEPFAWPEIFATLRRREINSTSEHRVLYATVEQWMGVLARLGALRWYRKQGRSSFSPTGASVIDVLDGQAAERREAQIKQEKKERAARKEAEQAATRAAEQEARRRTRLAIGPNGERRWVPK